MRLWLLRHAKSSWDDRSLEDEDRPLAPRGERAAGRMRDYFVAEAIRPALVLCSPALRTRQTLDRVLPMELGWNVAVRIEPSLYTFDAATLLDRLSEIPEGVDSVLLVGHNPAIQDLAVMLAARGDRLDRLTRKFPTAGLAEIEFPTTPWRDIRRASGELTRFVVPRNLGERQGSSRPIRDT